MSRWRRTSKERLDIHVEVKETGKWAVTEKNVFGDDYGWMRGPFVLPWNGLMQQLLGQRTYYLPCFIGKEQQSSSLSSLLSDFLLLTGLWLLTVEVIFECPFCSFCPFRVIDPKASSCNFIIRMWVISICIQSEFLLTFLFLCNFLLCVSSMPSRHQSLKDTCSTDIRIFDGNLSKTDQMLTSIELFTSQSDIYWRFGSTRKRSIIFICWSSIIHVKQHQNAVQIACEKEC